MRVELLSFTPDALNLLLRTKNTRLSHADDPATWPEEKKLAHLQYMLGTIKSSWEFVEFVFEIEEVTRAFTHQLVRTRHGSYAQQAMRVVDAREAEVEEPVSVTGENLGVWRGAVEHSKEAYGQLLDRGVPAQDARGLLPTNVHTSIMAKFNLRTLHEMAKLRLCTRTQSEYQDVFRLMRELVVEQYPWAAAFINVQCVADGTCAFPHYGPKSCPVWVPELDREEVKKTVAARFWSLRHESRPVASGGMAGKEEGEK
jgi:flavin-dependent thymidylate synthase